MIEHIFALIGALYVARLVYRAVRQLLIDRRSKSSPWLLPQRPAR